MQSRDQLPETAEEEQVPRQAEGSLPQLVVKDPLGPASAEGSETEEPQRDDELPISPAAQTPAASAKPSTPGHRAAESDDTASEVRRGNAGGPWSAHRHPRAGKASRAQASVRVWISCCCQVGTESINTEVYTEDEEFESDPDHAQEPEPAPQEPAAEPRTDEQPDQPSPGVSIKVTVGAFRALTVFPLYNLLG